MSSRPDYDPVQNGSRKQQSKKGKGGLTMQTKRLSEVTSGGLRPLSRRELEVMISRISAEVASQFADVDPVRVVYLGQEIFPRPMNTRRFVQVMSRYMVFN